MGPDEKTVGPGAGLGAAADPNVGQVLDGRYRLTKRLGEGGMGEVYAAEHIHIEKRVAIKLLRTEILTNEEAVGRFRQEARSASSIGHRNIVAIEDFGQLPDGRVYLAMELLHGFPLSELIKQRQPAERLIRILVETGHGLSAAHRKGIVHRDMKPENVFVTITPSGEDVPKLLDFGIAKMSGGEGRNHLTRPGAVFGTPFYMAPEQALGHDVDPRTDVYAMGVIMYEAFGGVLPFQGDTFMAILTQHITSEPRSLARVAAEYGRVLPPGIEEIIARAMRKDPQQRFQSMDELVAALASVYRSIADPAMSGSMAATLLAESSMSQNMGPRVVPYPGRSRRSRLGVFALLIVVMAAAGGGIAVLVRSRGGTTPGREDAGTRDPEMADAGVVVGPPDAAPPPPETADAATPPATTTVRISSRPPGAQVYGPRDVKLGRTPVDIEVRRGVPLRVTLKLRRHKDAKTTIDGSKRAVALELDELPRPEPDPDVTTPKGPCELDPDSVECTCDRDPSLPVCYLEP